MAATPLEPRPFAHVSVLAQEIVAAVASASHGLVVDATAGAGGHSALLLGAYPTLRLIAFDRDERAVAAARARLAEFGERATVVHGAFSSAPAWLGAAGIAQVDAVIADLGVSSAQLDEPLRGMSFRGEGPLDMRMDTSAGETAAELIARLDGDELADVIYQYGEERRSRRIARCIKQAEAAGELSTTLDLRRAVVRAVGPQRVGGVDPSTRTFQALRLAVNGELDELSALLGALPALLAPEGVAAIISFHSLEDRLVKRAFQDRDTWRRVTKKPVMAGDDEQRQNPRSRSAKLRVAERLAPEGAA